MVGIADVKLYKSSNNAFGGPITGTQIISGNFNNLFANVKKVDQVGGAEYYHCMYIKNTNASEDMDNFNFWLDVDTPPVDTIVKWGFESVVVSSTGYNWQPFFTSTGSNKDETADAAAYDITRFTLAAWFSTPTPPTPDEGFLVSKGGTGADTAGQNNNYSLWMENDGTMRGGFEETTGVDHYAQSPLSYADDNWHFALIYYDGTTVNLYVDNMTTPVATHATTTNPETNAMPIRINQNSRAVSGWLPAGATIDEVRIWNRGMTSSTERNNLLTNVVNTSGLVFEKTFGTPVVGKVAQTISIVSQAPTNVQWYSAGSEPSGSNVGRLKAGEYIPVWVWWHVDANAVARIDDTAIFNFSFLLPSGSTPDPGTGGGGGSGGGNLDTFGIRQIYATITGGRVYNSNWHTATAHQWDATGGQVPAANLDPQDSMADLISPTTCRAIVDPSSKTLTADTNSNKNSWRYYIKDPACTAASSPWKWSESVEITVYYKAGVSYSGGSIHVHCRLMGPGEHWNAITDDNVNACAAAGHEYSYEIKENGVNEFRKEEFHKSVAEGEGYAENIIFPDTNAPHDTWIGMKLVTKKKSSTSMHIEAWKDLTDGASGGTWIKAGEIDDDGTNWKITDSAGISSYGSLPAGSGNCTRISPIDAALTMTGSATGIRCDNTRVQFKKYSVREIDPDDEGSPGGPPPPDPGGGGGGGNPPPAPTDWKMAFVGDEGCGSITNAVRDLCKTYDYTVSVGDHAYASASCWTSTFSSLKPKFNAAYGNHEYSESGGVGPYKTFFGHNLTYFSFNFQNVHIVIIDSNINMDPGSAQHTFVSNDLHAAMNNSAIDWIFAVLHHPMFGASSSHSYNDGNSIQAFHQLFNDHEVAFVMTGHNHNWQATKQVAYNAASPTNPTVFDATPPFVKGPGGLVHIVTGTGGHDSGGGLYSLGSQPSFQLYQNRTNNGIFEVVASNNGKTLTCSFVNTNGDKFNTFVYTTT